jgi:hypothetical protein
MSGNNKSKARHTLWIPLLLFLVQFALCFRSSEMAWDGVFYYSCTRSIIFDGDLRLGNDLLLSCEAHPNHDFEAQRFEEALTPTGRVASPFAIGTSLLWLPWFATIYGLARLAGWVGMGPSTLTGYEWPFVWGMATVTCVYGWVSVLVGFRLVKKFVNNWAALAASATVMFTTPLLYYQFREPFYAHAASAMTTALFVAAWWHFAKQRNNHPVSALLLGILGGLTALVRSQNVTYLALPILTMLITGWPALRRYDWGTVWRLFIRILLIGLGASLVLTLQFAVWHVSYGQPFAVPQGAAFMDWSAPWVQHVLFSAFHGLLPWMPLTLPAIIGLIMLARRVPKLSIPLLITFLLQVYVNGCVHDWFGGGGYGARRFSSALVILLIGYACLLDWRRERWYRLLVIGLSGLLILHQWLILRYGFADQIGGHVISMSPNYEWHADSIARFGRQLVGYIPLAIQNPIQTLVLSASPSETARTSFVLFARQVLLLIGVLGVAHVLLASCRRLASRYATSPSTRYILAIGGTAAVVLADWWILRCA